MSIQSKTKKIIHFELDGYINAGNGWCDDGSGLTMPAVHFKSSSTKDCRSACDNLEKCVAFDINNNENCNMRFLSTKDAKAGGVETGHGVWEGGCSNACKSTIIGIQFNGEKGSCYAKDKGSILISK